MQRSIVCVTPCDAAEVAGGTFICSCGAGLGACWLGAVGDCLASTRDVCCWTAFTGAGGCWATSFLLTPIIVAAMQSNPIDGRRAGIGHFILALTTHAHRRNGEATKKKAEANAAPSVMCGDMLFQPFSSDSIIPPTATHISSPHNPATAATPSRACFPVGTCVFCWGRGCGWVDCCC